MEIGLKCSQPDNPTVLHVCCGTRALPKCLDGWKETRYDIDPSVLPDVVGNVTDMPFENSSTHVVWLEAGLEHLCEYDVTKCLLECYRVLTPGGMLYVSVPNLEAAAIAILQGKLEEPCYENERVRCRWLDAIYGHQDSVKENDYMLHRFGFTPATLEQRLSLAGFFDIQLSTHDEMLNAFAWRGMTQ